MNDECQLNLKYIRFYRCLHSRCSLSGCFYHQDLQLQKFFEAVGTFVERSSSELEGRNAFQYTREHLRSVHLKLELQFLTQLLLYPDPVRLSSSEFILRKRTDVAARHFQSRFPDFHLLSAQQP